MSTESRKDHYDIQLILEKHIPGDGNSAIRMREDIRKALKSFINSGLSDSKFLTELTSGSYQKFWACVSEALIAERLRDKVFGERNSIGEGPDLLLIDGTRKVWIEITCPKPTNISKDWLNPDPIKVIDFPHEAILLRWTCAIKAKAEKLIGSEDGTKLGYIKSGLVSSDDSYVIAVNACLLRSGLYPVHEGISGLPFAVEAVLSVGSHQLKIDKMTSEVVHHGHQFRSHLINHNNSQVPTSLFMDPRFNSISAIWALDLNGSSAIGIKETSSIIHNPNAINPLPTNFLPSDEEYVAILNKDELEVSKIPKLNQRCIDV